MKIIFGIPLRSKYSSTDWRIVCKQLQATIDSILDNEVPKDYSIKVIICGHDRPSFLEEKNYQEINFIESNSAIPMQFEDYMRDKKAKKRNIATYVDSNIDEDEQVIFMFFDADDLLHKKFIINILRDFESDAIDDIAFVRGYVFNSANREIGFCEGVRNVFYQRCGSCFISKVQGKSALHYLNQLNNHSKFPSVSEELGRKVKYSDFPGIAYIINHGANDVNQRRGNAPIDNLIKRTVTSGDIHKVFIKDFGIKF